MKHKLLLSLLSIIFICGLIGNAAAFAGAEGIKNRMKERLPIIVSLKQKGIIGEDNKGYLQFTGAVKSQEDIVNAENSDRKLVYVAIAQKQGSTAEVVGKRRALQIAEKANPGEWLQNASGNWYKK